jgi:hypothetical protein
MNVLDLNIRCTLMYADGRMEAWRAMPFGFGEYGEQRTMPV